MTGGGLILTGWVLWQVVQAVTCLCASNGCSCWSNPSHLFLDVTCSDWTTEPHHLREVLVGYSFVGSALCMLVCWLMRRHRGAAAAPHSTLTTGLLCMHLLAAALGAVRQCYVQSCWLHARTPYSVPLGSIVSFLSVCFCCDAAAVVRSRRML